MVAGTIGSRCTYLDRAVVTSALVCSWTVGATMSTGSGPRGRATLHVLAHRLEGQWEFERLEVELDGQRQRIRLLGPEQDCRLYAHIDHGRDAVPRVGS